MSVRAENRYIKETEDNTSVTIGEVEMGVSGMIEAGFSGNREKNDIVHLEGQGASGSGSRERQAQGMLRGGQISQIRIWEYVEGTGQ